MTRNDEILSCLESIARWATISQARRRRLGRLPATKLPPQSMWVMLTLINYRQRKRWAWKIFQKRVARDVARQHGERQLNVEEAIEEYAEGQVPGMPGWRYHLETNDSFIESSETGEYIHVDVCNGPDVINSGFFMDYVAKLCRPTAAEKRLLEFFPEGGGLTPAINWLRKAGFFHLIGPGDIEYIHFELCGTVDRYADAVMTFLADWEDESDRPELAPLIGDWKAACSEEDAVAGYSNDAMLQKAEVARQRWLRHLDNEADKLLYSELLLALANANAEKLPTYLKQALKVSHLADEAAEMLRAIQQNAAENETEEKN